MDQHTLGTVKHALLHELDVALQRSCHQSLQDVMTALRIHYANVGPDPSPDEVVDIVLRHGILSLRPTPTVNRIRTSLSRWRMGSLGICARCGTEIDAADLEREPMRIHCTRCERRL